MALTLQLLLALSKVDEWSYDSFHLEEASGGRPLSALSFALFKRSGIVSCLRLNEKKLARCGDFGRGTEK